MDEQLVLPDRFWAKVQKTESCWLWTGSLEGKRYGHFSKRGSDRPSGQAHRLAFWAIKGPIPEGMQLDHLCRVKHCVNPDHLEVVTNRENALRAALYRTHCRNGHPFSEENTEWQPTRFGGRARRCITCRRLHIRDYCRRVDGYYDRHPEERPSASA